MCLYWYPLVTVLSYANNIKIPIFAIEQNSHAMQSHVVADVSPYIVINSH